MGLEVGVVVVDFFVEGVGVEVPLLVLSALLAEDLSAGRAVVGFVAGVDGFLAGFTCAWPLGGFDPVGVFVAVVSFSHVSILFGRIAGLCLRGFGDGF